MGVRTGSVRRQTDADFSDLVRLMRRFVDDLMGLPEQADAAKDSTPL